MCPLACLHAVAAPADVASAERLVAATNAGIGVARAAFFPDISLSALAGFQNTGNGALFTAPNGYWALGPSTGYDRYSMPAPEGQLAVAKAETPAATAAYRATVLEGVPGGGGQSGAS